MKKIMNYLKSTGFNKIATTFALALVTVAEASTQSCIVFIFGQEDMPEELLG